MRGMQRMKADTLVFGSRLDEILWRLAREKELLLDRSEFEMELLRDVKFLAGEMKSAWTFLHMFLEAYFADHHPEVDVAMALQALEWISRYSFRKTTENNES